MGLSHDVRLRKVITPIYPDRCVVCQRPGPDAHVSVWTHSIGWHTFVFWHFGRLFRAKVPACAACRRRFNRHKWLRWGLNGVMLAAALWLVLYLLGEYQGPLRKWVWMGAALLVLAPYWLIEAFYAPAVALTAYSDEVDYEFADRSYAVEFARLNGAGVA